MIIVKRDTTRKARTMTANQAADYIFENLEEFKTRHADTIAKFESKGIEPQLALALTITLAANCKAITEAINAA